MRERMMKRCVILLASLAASTVLATGIANARGYRSGPVTTEFGTFSPAEMAAGGGDPYAAAQIREQRMIMQYQQQVYKQQQQMYKQYQEYLKKNPAAAKAMMNPPAQPVAPVAHTKKKKRTYVPAGTAKTAAATAKTDTAKSAAAKTDAAKAATK